MYSSIYKVQFILDSSIPKEYYLNVSTDHTQEEAAMAKKRDGATRFMGYVDCSGGPESCWPWTGARVPKGSGSFWINGRTVWAQRAAWLIFVGPIPDGLSVLHHCDNPPCVNFLYHLFLGTIADDMTYRDSKGRQVDHRGAMNNGAKLQEHEVLTIRRLYKTTDLSYERIAGLYGVTASLVGMIVRGKRWPHSYNRR